MSWESTVSYYRLVNEETRARLGGLHSAPLLLWSVDFAEIEALQVLGRWDDAGRRLAEAARAVEDAGAELLVLSPAAPTASSSAARRSSCSSVRATPTPPSSPRPPSMCGTQ